MLESSGIIGHLAKIVTLPLRITAAVAATAWLLLLVPPNSMGLSGSDIAALNHSRGWIFAAASLFSLVTIFGAISNVQAWIRKRSARSQVRRGLTLQAAAQRSWWFLARQQDGTYSSQLSIDLHVLNRRDKPIKIIGVKLIRPRVRSAVRTHVLLPLKGTSIHSPDHPAMPNEGVWANASIFVKGALRGIGRPLTISIEVLDDRESRYVIKNLKIEAHGQTAQRINFVNRFKKFLKFWQNNSLMYEELDWKWSTCNHELVDIADVVRVLNEERRIYAVRGRREGKLGSLNTGLQSEPNYGWTKAGEVPQLLWPAGNGERVHSENLDLILSCHNKLDGAARTELESLLLNYLHRGSPYADVSYAIFLCLHRMGRTLDALQRSVHDLKGDKVFGYSNVLGVFSALISREHEEWPTTLIDAAEACFGADETVEFRLLEKLNLARLRK